MANLLRIPTGVGFLTFAKTKLSLAIATTLLPNMVLAQDQPDDSGYEMTIEEVIVTGSRIITEDGFGRTSPVTVVGMDEIQSFGFNRIEDVLNTLPQVEADENAMISNGSAGIATINLRGLGAKRTLVLINGRRLQPGGVKSEAADINQIPAQLVERVEVLTGGASATYGADAVAGVVNFIMRKVDGVEISASINGYQHDNRNKYIRGLMDEKGYEYPTGNSGIDGKGYDISIIIGGDFADGRGNATVYATWRKNEEMLQSARDYSSCSLNRWGTACGGSLNADPPNFFIAPLVEDGWGPYGYDYFQEELLTQQPDSSLSLWDDSNPNRHNYAPVNFFQRPDERWSAGAFANFEINPHAVTYLEIMGMQDGTRTQLAVGGTFFHEVYPLSIDNAYFHENFRASLEEYWPGEDQFGVYIGKRNVEGGPRNDILEHNSLRIVAGIGGLLAGDWDYDISYQHAQTSSSSTYVNDMLAPKLFTAVNPDLCEPDPGCIPYRVFTYQGVSEEAARNLSGTGIMTGETATDIFQAYATGNTNWGLPAGGIMVAAGYEHRKVKIERLSDTVFATGELLGWGVFLQDIIGRYSVNELFVEANVPLLADRVFAQNLTLDLAYRWSDYSTSGGSGTYRAGLDWQALDWLRIRTGFNHAVRAPNVGELFVQQQISSWWGIFDPCAGEEPIYSLEQCARSGVTAEQYGNIAQDPVDEGAVNVLWGGNPDLDPEEADTFTVGLVFDAGDAMRLSLDYWDIQIDGVISQIHPEVTLESCALRGYLCDLIQRGPNGSLWRTNDGYVVNTEWNLGGWHWRGVDVAWDWLPNTHWRLGLIGTWYLKKEITYIADDPESSVDCAGKIDYWCDGQPKWRHTASATYDSNDFWAITARWRYFHSVSYEEGEAEALLGDKLNAENYFDLNAIFRFGGTHDLSLGINNILDKEPPLMPTSLSTNANTIAGYYDTLGRYLFARVTMRW